MNRSWKSDLCNDSTVASEPKVRLKRKKEEVGCVEDKQRMDAVKEKAIEAIMRYCDSLYFKENTIEEKLNGIQGPRVPSKYEFESLIGFIEMVSEREIIDEYKELVKNHFGRMVQWFHKDYMEGEERPIPARINGVKVSLLDLYLTVKGLGGHTQVIMKNNWIEVAYAMGFPKEYVNRVKTARIQTLKAEFESLNMKETEGVDEFAVKIASTLEQFEDLDMMTVEEVIGRLKAHEERMKGYGESDDRKLLLTHQEWSERNKKKGEGDFKSKSNRGGFGGSRGRGRGRGRNHGGRGRGRSGSYHQREGSQGASGSQDKSRVQCYNCQEYGHYAAECKNPRRERNHENNLIQEHHDDEPALLLSTFESNGDGGRVLLNEENVTPQLRTHGAAPNQSRVWYLDTGASNHMTGDKDKFRDLNETVQGSVKFGNESKVRIEGKGSIVFQCKNGE
ncbi:zinc finger, CCHC-type containing protein, partial [Tanacetum coccineum]